MYLLCSCNVLANLGSHSSQFKPVPVAEALGRMNEMHFVILKHKMPMHKMCYIQSYFPQRVLIIFLNNLVLIRMFILNEVNCAHILNLALKQSHDAVVLPTTSSIQNVLSLGIFFASCKTYNNDTHFII